MLYFINENAEAELVTFQEKTDASVKLEENKRKCLLSKLNQASDEFLMKNGFFDVYTHVGSHKFLGRNKDFIMQLTDEVIVSINASSQTDINYGTGYYGSSSGGKVGFSSNKGAEMRALGKFVKFLKDNKDEYVSYLSKRCGCTITKSFIKRGGYSGVELSLTIKM